MRRKVETGAAPKAIGPYVQAVVAGGFVWASGQVALDPATGALCPGGIEQETEQVLANLRAVLEAAGSGLDRAVRMTVYLTDMRDFEAMNRVYAGVFAGDPPARVTVEVSALPRGARVEIDAVAVVES